MSFLEEYQKLIQKSPTMPRMGLRNEEADYTEYIFRSRNAYFSFTGGNLLDCAYLYDSGRCTDCLELSFCYDCELCLECTDCNRCYSSSYLDNCQNLTDCHFCSHCRNCSDLFGCFGLKFKKYCIFNRQYSKKEYKERLIGLMKTSPEEHLKKLEKLKRRYPTKATDQVRTENSEFGDHMVSSANCYWCFDSSNCRDSAYLSRTNFALDCLDCLAVYKCELCWECQSLGHSYSCSFIDNGDHLYDCHFCACCYRSKHLFGCVNLYQTKYRILNKQYKKADYFAKIKEIKKELG